MVFHHFDRAQHESIGPRRAKFARFLVVEGRKGLRGHDLRAYPYASQGIVARAFQACEETGRRIQGSPGRSLWELGVSNACTRVPVVCLLSDTREALRVRVIHCVFEVSGHSLFGGGQSIFWPIAGVVARAKPENSERIP